MNEPVDPVLLLRGDLDAAAGWVRTGLAAADVASMPGGWVAIAPAGQHSQAAPPYEDAADVLFGRALPRGLRPALGLRVVGDRLVVSLDLGGLWSRRGWLAWQPGTGLVRPGGLPVAAVDDLLEVAGVSGRHTLDAVVEVLHDGSGNAATAGASLLGALGLAAADGFGQSGWVGRLPGAERVEPREQDVARFERAVRATHEQDERSR